jgi:hypothetical protein
MVARTINSYDIWTIFMTILSLAIWRRLGRAPQNDTTGMIWRFGFRLLIDKHTRIDTPG